MAILQQDLATKWNLSKGRISQLVAEGMPLTSVEDAERWREERHKDTGHAPGNHKIGEGGLHVEQDSGIPKQTADEEILERQRFLVRVSRSQYLKAVQEGSPQQARLYSSYDKTLATLTKLEKQEWERAIANRDYIRISHAVERFGKILLQLRQELDQAEGDLPLKMNPEDPAKALKAYQEWKRALMDRVSQSSDISIEDAMKNDETN
jgi:hypothetical protein